MAIEKHPAFISLRNHCQGGDIDPTSLSKAQVEAVIGKGHSKEYLSNLRRNVLQRYRLFKREAKRAQLQAGARTIFGNDCDVTLRPDRLVVWPNGAPYQEEV